MIDKEEMQIEEIFTDLYNLNNTLPNNNFFMVHLNVRSLNTNFNKLELFIEHLVIKPDIIVCTETWLLSCYTFFEMNDYNIFYNSSNNNRADGVVLYIKKSLKHDVEIDVIDNVKIISTIIKLKGNKNLKISGIYRCQDIPKENFIDAITKFLDVNKHGNNHFLVGDFNINLLNSDIATNEYLNNLLDRGYIPYFNGVTRPNDLGGTCIDNIFVKSNIEKIRSFTYANVFTDHYPIFVALDLFPIKSMLKETYFINHNLIKVNSSLHDWSHMLDIKDPEVFFKLLIENIKNIIDVSRSKVNKTKNNNKPRSKWITKGIIKSCKTKETLYRLWNLDRNNVKLKSEYNAYCKILKRVITLAKNNYESKYVKKISKDSKKMWQYVNTKIGKKN